MYTVHSRRTFYRTRLRFFGKFTRLCGHRQTRRIHFVVPSSRRRRIFDRLRLFGTFCRFVRSNVHAGHGSCPPEKYDDVEKRTSVRLFLPAFCSSKNSRRNPLFRADIGSACACRRRNSVRCRQKRHDCTCLFRNAHRSHGMHIFCLFGCFGRTRHCRVVRKPTRVSRHRNRLHFSAKRRYCFRDSPRNPIASVSFTVTCDAFSFLRTRTNPPSPRHRLASAALFFTENSGCLSPQTHAFAPPQRNVSFLPQSANNERQLRRISAVFHATPVKNKTGPTSSKNHTDTLSSQNHPRPNTKTARSHTETVPPMFIDF